MVQVFVIDKQIPGIAITRHVLIITERFSRLRLNVAVEISPIQSDIIQ